MSSNMLSAPKDTTRTILVIDDDSNFLNPLKMSLEEEGYNVITAENPKSGWESMEKHEPDILLVDWELPEMKGTQFIKLLRENKDHNARYVIMVTGHSTTDYIVQGLDAGADDYLIKPFAIQELMARIRVGIRIRELEKKIKEEIKKLTVLEMALSVADKIGNPISAAKLHLQLLMEQETVKKSPELVESLTSLFSMLEEALELISKYQKIKEPHSVPAPGGKTMIAPE